MIAEASRSTRSTRPQEVADAALEVLAARGSRGLTHRAVDGQAGLPPGSTSNYFRTRSALLTAALRRHVELELPASSGLEEAPELRLSRDQARELILSGLEYILEPSRRALLAARYELVLESTRRAALKREFDAARERFVRLAETILGASGCATPRLHAAQLVALMDGLLLDQLLATSFSLDRDGIEQAIERQLATC